MSSIIAIGLLGKLFQILSLQPFHEINIQWWTDRQTDRQTDRHVCLFGVLYNKYTSTLTK